jgi:2-phospho-L-lactate guanylyltransferase
MSLQRRLTSRHVDARLWQHRRVSGDSSTYDDVTAVLALKGFATAKSRLDLPLPLRQRLAWTMAVDTLRALAAVVGRLVVVSDQPALQSRLRRVGVEVSVIDDGGSTGLNAALARGAAVSGPGPVLACVGDLPALRPHSVQRILAAMRDSPADRSFLVDASGVGTTMLGVREGVLEPRFQGRSAAAHHQSGAVGLSDEVLGGSVADARQDVDNRFDLMTAAGLGLGLETSALIVPGTGHPGAFEVVTTTGWRAPDGEPLAVSARGRRLRLAPTALASGLRPVRSGQRLHAVVHDDRVLCAWMP